MASETRFPLQRRGRQSFGRRAHAAPLGGYRVPELCRTRAVRLALGLIGEMATVTCGTIMAHGWDRVPGNLGCR